MRYTSNGQYVLNQLTLTKDNVEIDLSSSFGDVVIYESIFDHFMTATVTFVDTYDIINQLPIDGEERIIIDFETAGSDNPIHFEGLMYRAVSETMSEQSRAMVLHFASEPAMKDQRVFESGGYRDTLSNIAKKVYQKIDALEKPLDVEPTVKIENIVFPHMRPSTGMEFLASRSVSQTQNVGYLFYETSQAFHYRSIQSLLQQESELMYLYGQRGVYNDPKNAIVEKFNSYQDFEELEPSQYMDKVKSGFYGSDYEYLDLIKKRITPYKESRKDTFDSNKSLGKYPYRENHASQDFSDRRVFKTTMDESGLVNVHQRNSHVMSSLDSYRARFSVFGDSAVSAGNTCHAVIPIKGSSRIDNPTDFYTGRFLISEIKHRFTVDKYNQTMTIVKDAFEDSSDD